MNKNTKRELRFSLFHNETLGHFNVSPTKEIGLSELFKIYQSAYLKEKSIQLKDAVGIERDELKKKLPFITPAGTFTQRKSEHLQHYNSSLLCLDIDGLTETDAPRLRNYLSKLRGCLFTAVSPRMKGVKALFNVSCEIPLENRHKALKSNINNISDALGLSLIADKIDCAQFVLPQPFFLAHDKDAFYLETDETLLLELEPYVPYIQEQTQYTPRTFNSSTRIEKYLHNACTDLVKFFALCSEGSRHSNIIKVRALSSWTHYAPHLEPEIKDALFNAVVSMYGNHQNANRNGAIRTFNECWQTPPQHNNTIEGIINELQTLEQ
jgi:hypothetical protein